MYNNAEITNKLHQIADNDHRALLWALEELGHIQAGAKYDIAEIHDLVDDLPVASRRSVWVNAR